jgi:hypothetical protein
VAAVKQKYRSCDGTQSLQAALTGEIEAARGMFFAFAQRNDLLAPRLDEVVAAETLGAFGASASN